MYSSFNVILVPSFWVFLGAILASTPHNVPGYIAIASGAVGRWQQVRVNLEVAVGCPCYLVNRSK